MISSEGEFKLLFKAKEKCKDLDIYNDLLFVTYYSSNTVSIYKLSKYVIGDTYYLSTEFLNDLIFKIPLLEFHTKGSNLALIFSGINTIQLYEIESAYLAKFMREVPLFKYKKNMNFLINKDTKDVTYSRFNEFLYVILYNIEDEKDKKLFCFNLKDSNHDILYSVIDLDPFYYGLNNKIFIENGKFVSTIYIYLFYGGKHYQYIKFEPDNRLQITNPDFDELCLPKDVNNFKSYKPINITMEMYPIYTDYTPTQNTSTDIVLMCMNYGLKIESRTNSNTLLYQNKEEVAAISLLDYFDGFNSNFSVSTKGIDSSVYSIDIDNTYNFLLESVNSTQKVIFTMEYNEYVLVFFNETGKLQVYLINDDNGNLEKLDKEYNYNDLVGGCSVDLIRYSYIEWTDDSFFIFSWKYDTDKVSQSFLYKVYHIDKISKEKIDLTLMFQTYYTNRVVSAALSKFIYQGKEQYALVMTAERESPVDTFIIYINFIWDDKFKCKVDGINKFSSFNYDFDSFIVNSFIFYEDTQLIIVSVDNFGLVVIDWVSHYPIQIIPIDDKYFQVPPTKMLIYGLVPLDMFGIRVLLKDEGGFSFFWNDVYEGENEIFRNFEVRDRFENINSEVPTSLLSEFKGGYAQVIKYPKSDDNFDYYLRVYIPFNHDHSKNYKEFLIDKIDDWEAMDYITSFSDVEIGIILVCGYQLFIYYVMVAPELKLNRHVWLNITASNNFSNQTITIDVDRNEINSNLNREYVLLAFLLIIILFIIIFNLIFKKIMDTKIKDDQKSNEADVRLSKKVLTGSRHSEEIKIDRLTYEKIKKFESKLETLHENLEDDDEEENNEDDQKIELNIRNTMNYKIQDNTESILSSYLNTDRNSEITNYVRYSYNRSSTRSYNESLNKKHNPGLRG